ncbi:hypothetical protein F5Y13DRAFT_171455 [Hypoxylon sp. FL1857]|nr:hypothetical protein F5Y13DRAFT_171455 [Hypoxylon sp. FL1857]
MYDKQLGYRISRDKTSVPNSLSPSIIMMHSRRIWLEAITDLFLLASLLMLLPCTLASPSIPPSLPPSTSDLTGQSERNYASINDTSIIQKRQMSAGSSCSGSEGQWNCLTNQWQRCASGQWSVVMDCAAGTICTPSGLTYDFFVSFANGAAGGSAPATSDGTSGRRNENTHRMLLAALGVASTVIALVTH